MTKTLSRLHRVRPGSARDFDISNLSQIAVTAGNNGRVFARLLAAVASISLVVGGKAANFDPIQALRYE